MNCFSQGARVILADDPHSVKPDTIKDIPIVRTVVGGITGYEA